MFPKNPCVQVTGGPKHPGLVDPSVQVLGGPTCPFLSGPTCPVPSGPRCPLPNEPRRPNLVDPSILVFGGHNCPGLVDPSIQAFGLPKLSRSLADTLKPGGPRNAVPSAPRHPGGSEPRRLGATESHPRPQWTHTFLLIDTAGLQGYELFFKTRELKKKWLEQFEMAL